MKASADTAARKRPVNLTLNEDLVCEAKSLTDNLSAVVESLLAEFVNRERRERLRKSKAAEAAVLLEWGKLPSESGAV